MQDASVSAVLTSNRAKGFAEASTKPVARVGDGDALWLQIRTERPLKHYVHRNPDDPDSVAELLLMIAPRGSYTSTKQRFPGTRSVWPLKSEELESHEIAISLAPAAARWFIPKGGRFSKSNKARFFLEFVGGPNAGRGQWHNEIFVMGSKQHIDALGRVTSELVMVPMAKVSIEVNVPDGISKYRALYSENCDPEPKSTARCKVSQ